ncbi:hypothetical protein Syun_008773 [Stephania yunnanensis]|uniref:Uncharacterized protein n=1 Tax=Stephania yunnanensis TaxID=152371 RepID=A0AAP0KFC6_9MAGN
MTTNLDIGPIHIEGCLRIDIIFWMIMMSLYRNLSSATTAMAIVIGCSIFFMVCALMTFDIGVAYREGVDKASLFLLAGEAEAAQAVQRWRLARARRRELEGEPDLDGGTGERETARAATGERETTRARGRDISGSGGNWRTRDSESGDWRARDGETVATCGLFCGRGRWWRLADGGDGGLLWKERQMVW